MPLLAYNKTGTAIPLPQAHPPVTLPASVAPPARGKAYDVTAELWPNATIDPANGRTGGLDHAAYLALSLIAGVDFGVLRILADRSGRGFRCRDGLQLVGPAHMHGVEVAALDHLHRARPRQLS